MRLIIIISTLLISLTILSCNDSISPYAPFKEDYVLSGIIRGDSSYQVITLSRSYQPNGPDPLSYKDDPAITGAKVEIFYDNKIYVLRDSAIARLDTSHFNTPFKFYYTKELKPDINKNIEIKAIMPNGHILSSATKTPNVQSPGFFDTYNNYYFPVDSLNIDTTFWKDSIIRWEDLGRNTYAPLLNINYFVKGDSRLYKIAVPLFYQPDSTPVYYHPASDNFLIIEIPNVTKTLEKLANSITNKQNVTIVNMTLDIIVFDEYLSIYYSSIELGTNGFTIRVDVPEYSDIKGGLGFFGSYVRATQALSFKKEYLNSLGFNVKP